MTLPTIAAVIPTRNRGPLAIAAMRSLLAQDRPVDVFVSDNSPSPDEALREECHTLGATYLRPAGSLSQATHWDWALRQVLERSAASHVTVHYDRKVTKPQHLPFIRSVAEQWPDKVISWPHDYVSDVPPPMRLWQPRWSGNVYELRTARIVQLTAAGRAGAIPSHALPLLSNCLVPRAVLTAVRARFGDLCDSTTPDSCFAFRFATLRDSYLHLDRAMGVLYAAHRSAGSGYLRGRGSDWAESRKLWGDEAWLAAAPIAGLNLGLNMLYHEYELVRAATGNQLPPIDRTGYVEDLAGSLRLVRDPETRSALRRVLREAGWRGSETRGRLRAFVRHKLLGFLDEHLGVRLPNIDGRVFRNDEEALQYALSHPRPRQKEAPHLTLLEPELVGTT